MGVPRRLSLSLFLPRVSPWDHMSNRQNERKSRIVGSGLGMFKFVPKPSQPIGDHPLTDTLFSHIGWKYKPSQAIGPLWPCPLRVESNFVRHSHVYHPA